MSGKQGEIVIDIDGGGSPEDAENKDVANKNTGLGCPVEEDANNNMPRQTDCIININVPNEDETGREGHGVRSSIVGLGETVGSNGVPASNEGMTEPVEGIASNVYSSLGIGKIGEPDGGLSNTRAPDVSGGSNEGISVVGGTNDSTGDNCRGPEQPVGTLGSVTEDTNSNVITINEGNSESTGYVGLTLGIMDGSEGPLEITNNTTAPNEGIISLTGPDRAASNNRPQIEGFTNRIAGQGSGVRGPPRQIEPISDYERVTRWILNLMEFGINPDDDLSDVALLEEEALEKMSEEERAMHFSSFCYQNPDPPPETSYLNYGTIQVRSSGRITKPTRKNKSMPGSSKNTKNMRRNLSPVAGCSQDARYMSGQYGSSSSNRSYNVNSFRDGNNNYFTDDDDYESSLDDASELRRRGTIKYGEILEEISSDMPSSEDEEEMDEDDYDLGEAGRNRVDHGIDYRNFGNMASKFFLLLTVLVVLGMILYAIVFHGGNFGNTLPMARVAALNVAMLKEAREEVFDRPLEKIPQDDPRLRDYIIDKKYLDPPSNHSYNLSDPMHVRTVVSEEVIKILQNKTNGFFVEVGALDGEKRSNTLDLEMNYGWMGLLLEPNPWTYELVKLKRRKVWTANLCLSTQPNTHKGVYLVNYNKGKLSIPRSNVSTGDQSHVYYPAADKEKFLTQCMPLLTIMNALEKLSKDAAEAWKTDTTSAFGRFSNMDEPTAFENGLDKTIAHNISNSNVTTELQPKKEPVVFIDFLSLDTEGHELDILQAIEFSKIEIKVMSIELLNDETNAEEETLINAFMKLKEYELVSTIPRPGYSRINIFALESFLKAPRKEPPMNNTLAPAPIE